VSWETTARVRRGHGGCGDRTACVVRRDLGRQSDNPALRPGQGFDKEFALPCPDDCGSHLSFDGQKLHLSQWYPKKLLTLGNDGKVERVISVPHGICGQVYVDGCFYLATTDAEESTDYWLTRVDPRPAQPKIEDLVRIPLPRGRWRLTGRISGQPPRTKPDRLFCRPD